MPDYNVQISIKGIDIDSELRLETKILALLRPELNLSQIEVKARLKTPKKAPEPQLTFIMAKDLKREMDVFLNLDPDIKADPRCYKIVTINNTEKRPDLIQLIVVEPGTGKKFIESLNLNQRVQVLKQ